MEGSCLGTRLRASSRLRDPGHNTIQNDVRMDVDHNDSSVMEPQGLGIDLRIVMDRRDAKRTGGLLATFLRASSSSQPTGRAPRQGGLRATNKLRAQVRGRDRALDRR
jgi:hypothetical protein